MPTPPIDREPVPDRALRAALAHTVVPGRAPLARWQAAAEGTPAGLAARTAIILDALQWGGRLLPVDADLLYLLGTMCAEWNRNAREGERIAGDPGQVPDLGRQCAAQSETYRTAAKAVRGALDMMKTIIARRQP